MKYFLGIDLGTTKVAAVIADAEGNLLAASSADHHAALNAGENRAEQDPVKIWDCALAQIAALPEDLRKQIAAVGVTGQMHSVTGSNGTTMYPLVTWQDRRVSASGKLDGFCQKSGRTLRDGFGGATLAWLAAEGRLAECRFAVTISDWVAGRLAGNSQWFTDPTHAASWGLYDAEHGCWDAKALAALAIPEKLLPEIRPTGSVIGKLAAEWAKATGIPAGIPVVNAIGDNQASILATGKDFDRELYLTLGTGAQLSAVAAQSAAASCAGHPELECRPFVDGKVLVVAAPLCGGRAFAWLGDTVNAFRSALGEAPLPGKKLLDDLDTLGVAVLAKDFAAGGLDAIPSFLGERHDPERRGSISGITLKNLTPGNLAAALALGIVRNLKSGFTAPLLAGRTTVVGSGNGVRLVHSIQMAIKMEFGLPLTLNNGREEAACGAAKLASRIA